MGRYEAFGFETGAEGSGGLILNDLVNGALPYLSFSVNRYKPLSLPCLVSACHIPLSSSIT
jgi:hypothetical protein